MGKIAFVFAGQGSQTAGMGRELYNAFGSVRDLFGMAEKTREGVTRLCFEGPQELLNQTVNAQPCLFLTDLACALALNEKGITANGAAGFSLGEIPTLCHAGFLDAGQAFELVCRRAALMQTCAQEHGGAMFAVLKLADREVDELCAGVPGAWPVNYNCPGQTVAACAGSSEEQLLRAVTERGGKAVRLAVSGAFHSPLMDGASVGLAEYLDGVCFGEPSLPLYSNVTGGVYGDPRTLLARQVNSPVLWRKTIENMAADGFDTFVELGPGKTLSGLIRKINAGVRTHNVCDVKTLCEAAEAITYA